ncbi:helix-turn-helix domain-containing protein [Mesobacterium sp. TK19101]|uniref:Helix-turn-helix domain-containing protein n=1 Tax=Mesobacterium hydrothermale TaxID=3111907 RepID=A0ABU6HIA2_9RHOB|nr:helix-turn-helix domain-containing protein [Mesobacterium sp. TK19101]MEC3862184.1 helix-turn-helix domain-containing protein [Mesobacterium sp. TK19101]
MIGWKSQRKDSFEVVEPKGFDDFELRLGDLMRGERATMGKSLLDVQRELRIKASYIAAIENCDPSAFDTPGFIAGYVRSYARYLNMDPDETYAAFCAESGFATAHGMSEKASSIRKSDVIAPSVKSADRDMFTQPNLPFAPGADSFLSRIEPGALGSTLVLLLLMGGIGYGGWSVLQEVQRVQLSPVEQTPVVLSDLDPLQTAVKPVANSGDADMARVDAGNGAGVFTPPGSEAMDRLYRPQALDVPVLIARDAPISTLDPSTVGAFAEVARPNLPQIDTDSAVQMALTDLGAIAADPDAAPVPQPKVFADGAPGVTIVAVRPSWVRVRSAEGTSIYEGIMNAGDTWSVPQLAEAPTIRVGESGAIYFAMNGNAYGPAGPSGSVTSNLPLAVDHLIATYQVANIQADTDLARVVAELADAPVQD